MLLLTKESVDNSRDEQEIKHVSELYGIVRNGPNDIRDNFRYVENFQQQERKVPSHVGEQTWACRWRDFEYNRN